MDYKNRAKAITKYDILKRIEVAKKIVLTVHVHPDGDALGSMLALYEVLLRKQKDVTMVVDDVIPKKFHGLPYVDHILIPKQYDYIDETDLLIVLDASTFERIGRIGEIFTCHMINIDHHVSNTRYADELYLDDKAAATGEILTYLLADWHMEMTPSMANALYMAIATDCGFFKYGNTKGQTLKMAAICVEHGASPQDVSDMVELSTPNRIEATRKALDTITFHGDGKIGKIVVDHVLMQLVENDTDGFVDYVRNVEGVDVTILFKEYSSQHTRISFRSKKTNVNVLASHFDGGGHVRAAGCTVKAPLEEAIPLVIAYTEEFIKKEHE